MADKIINRRPFSVNVDVDIDYKFFSHVNWKGICTDKNYFNLDQETFEDCKNVYIDSEGLLKSRPAFKGVEYDFDDDEDETFEESESSKPKFKKSVDLSKFDSDSLSEEELAEKMRKARELEEKKRRIIEGTNFDNSLRKD